jgi:hypothetical protein
MCCCVRFACEFLLVAVSLFHRFYLVVGWWVRWVLNTRLCVRCSLLGFNMDIPMLVGQKVSGLASRLFALLDDSFIVADLNVFSEFSVGILTFRVVDCDCFSFVGVDGAGACCFSTARRAFVV